MPLVRARRLAAMVLPVPGGPVRGRNRSMAAQQEGKTAEPKAVRHEVAALAWSTRVTEVKPVNRAVRA
jgi:hypothetical protein